MKGRGGGVGGQLGLPVEETLRDGIWKDGSARVGFSRMFDKLPKRGRIGRKLVGGLVGRRRCGVTTGCRRERWRHKQGGKPGKGDEKQGGETEEMSGGIRQEEIQGCWQDQGSPGGTGLLVLEQ